MIPLRPNSAPFTVAEKVKLAGIEEGATFNALDSELVNRANHTGTQLAATISDFAEATDDRVNTLISVSGGLTRTYDDAAGTLSLVAREQMTLGPWHVVDVAASATAQGGLLFAGGAAPVAMDMKMWRSGRVIGMTIAANAPVTAGSAVAKLRIGGVVTDFGGADPPDLIPAHAISFGAYDLTTGPAFANGEALGIAVVSSGLAPAGSLEMSVTVTVLFN